MSHIKEVKSKKTLNFYKTFGVMLDCSRNAVMKTDKLKKFIDYISLFGYNALEIYAEDTVEIKGEKRVGYMRGKYSGEELKEIDDYAKSRGVELIPCVQTLAHFTNVCKIADYNKLFEMGDILFCGEEETYAFIEKIIASCRDNFSSDKINIGMDEAEFVGLGKYLKKNGYKNRFDILKNHLKRVAAICEKYNFRPHMWSDMFFKLTTEDGSYYGKTSDVPKELKDSVPETVSLTYFDYYHQTFEDYDRMIKAHKKLTDNVWFAGGAWTWNGFAPNIGFSINTMKPAMLAVRENGVENVIITIWGDNGKEASYFSVIATLYAIRRFAEGEEDEKIIADDFKKLTGYSLQS